MEYHWILTLCVYFSLLYIIIIICRYDVALGLNTFGVKHVLNLAKSCINLKVLVHVSTGWYLLDILITPRE